MPTASAPRGPVTGELLLRALRELRTLRDKVIVVALGEAITKDAALLRSASEQLALLRTSGVRPVLVCEGPGARALAGALEAEGERGLVLPALNVLTVHALPPGVPLDASLTVPGIPLADGRLGLPVVNPVALVHLQALGYVPVLVPPVVEPDGALVELGARPIAGAVAGALEAAAVVSLCGPAEGSPPRLPWFDVAPDAASDLVTALLLSSPVP